MKAQECTATSICSECGKRKPREEFYSSRATRKCKQCELEQSRKRYLRNRERRLVQCAEYRDANKAKIKRSMADWYVENREHVLERCAEYNKRPEVVEREKQRHAKRYLANRDSIQEKRKAFYESNPDARRRWKEYTKRHYRENKPYYTARVRAREKIIKRATPPWANRKEIEKFYVEAAKKTAETGILHVVDHIVPLQGKRVSGLHVENNLRVITALENARKSNKFEC